MAEPAEQFNFGEETEVEDPGGEALRLLSEETKPSAELQQWQEFEQKKAALHGKVEESESNWLVSYADMMTLLVGFFVMLLAFSKIDQTAFEKIKRETTKTFGGEYQIPFEDVANRLKKVVATPELQSQVAFEQTDEGITITFRGALFFDSGSAELRGQAKELLNKLIPTVLEQAKDFGILVEGHTDNTPMRSKVFPSNWELSSVRACTVLRMFEDLGFPRSRLKALGWGEMRPVVPNDDANGKHIAENQAQNRRVVVKILKNFTE